MFKIYDGRKEFYQWDLNQKLIVSDKEVNEVHFCNRTDDCSLVCEVYELDGVRVVDVPNVLLQDAWRIRAFAYASDHTKTEVIFTVKPRSKPSDYIYTETEIKRYEDLEARLEALEGAGVPAAKTEYYYNSFAKIFADVRAGSFDNAVDAETANIKVNIDDVITVSLLANVQISEHAQMTKKTFVINLGEHNINITNNASIMVASGANVTINATSGGVYKIDCGGFNPMYIGQNSTLNINGGNYKFVTASKNATLFSNEGELTIKDATCTLNNDDSAESYSYCVTNKNLFKAYTSSIICDVTAGNVIGVWNTDSKTAYIYDCYVSANTNTDGSGASSSAIYNSGRLYVYDSEVFADAPGGNASNECATGIMNSGEAVCINTNVTGTLSGLQNNAKAYVRGGKFIGYTHGGFYIAHGVEGEAFIKDATILAGNYSGIHTDVIGNCAVLAAMYVGGGREERNSNIGNAYFDNCVFGDKQHNVYDIVMRGSMDEVNNTIHLSNCTFTHSKMRNDSETHAIYIGAGCVYDGEIHFVTNMETLGQVYYTNELYRRIAEIETVSGADYNALASSISYEAPVIPDVPIETEEKKELLFVPFTYANSAYTLDDLTIDDIETAFNEDKYIVAKINSGTSYYYLQLTARVVAANGIITYYFSNGTANNPHSENGYLIVMKLTNGNSRIMWNKVGDTKAEKVTCSVAVGGVSYTNVNDVLAALAAYHA